MVLIIPAAILSPSPFKFYFNEDLTLNENCWKKQIRQNVGFYRPSLTSRSAGLSPHWEEATPPRSAEYLTPSAIWKNWMWIMKKTFRGRQFGICRRAHEWEWVRTTWLGPTYINKRGPNQERRSSSRLQWKKREVFEVGHIKPVISYLFHYLGANQWYCHLFRRQWKLVRQRCFSPSPSVFYHHLVAYLRAPYFCGSILLRALKCKIIVVLT